MPDTSLIEGAQKMMEERPFLQRYKSFGDRIGEGAKPFSLAAT
jgi:hypothetical protein